MLQVAPSGYWRYANQQRNPERRCARAQRDDALMPHIQRVWHANMQVYGADKVWKQLNREGIAIARCTVERLMRRLGLQGVCRGKVVRTTISDGRAPCPLDRVNRKRGRRPILILAVRRNLRCPARGAAARSPRATYCHHRHRPSPCAR